MDRREETKEVKRLMVSKGYKNVKVGHGAGTAWGWLHVGADVPRPEDCQCSEERFTRCLPCTYAIEKIGKEVRELTDRHGDYGGNIRYSLSFV